MVLLPGATYYLASDVLQKKWKRFLPLALGLVGF